MTAVTISAIAIVLLIINNEILKPRWAKISPIPIPIELTLVVAGTLISSALDLRGNYSIRTIGNIPTGFPDPTVPDLNLAKDLVVDGFVIAVVSYTVSVSMALIFAQKLNYEIGFNQELLAMVTDSLNLLRFISIVQLISTLFNSTRALETFLEAFSHACRSQHHSHGHTFNKPSVAILK